MSAGSEDDAVHWAYVFAALARFYGFDWRAVMAMTPRQTQHYLSMIAYVSEWGKEAGVAPALPVEYVSGSALESEAKRVGLRLPVKGSE